MNQPLLTIGIATLDRPTLLAEALESILASSTKHQFHLEVVISDMGTNPLTNDVVGRFIQACPENISTTYIQPKDVISGIANWDTCLAHATGRYYMMIGDDDKVNPTDLPNFLSCLNGIPDDVSVILGSPTDMNSNGEIIYRKRLRSGKYNPDIFLIGVISRTIAIRWCCFAFRREIIKRYDPYKYPFPGGGGGADGATILAALDAGNAYITDSSPAFFRRHLGNDSGNIDLTYQVSQRETLANFIRSKICSSRLSSLGHFWNATGIFFQLIKWQFHSRIPHSQYIELKKIYQHAARDIIWKSIPYKLRITFWAARSISNATHAASKILS